MPVAAARGRLARLHLKPVVDLRTASALPLAQALGRVGDEEEQAPAFVLQHMRLLVSAQAVEFGEADGGHQVPEGDGVERQAAPDARRAGLGSEAESLSLLEARGVPLIESTALRNCIGASLRRLTPSATSKVPSTTRARAPNRNAGATTHRPTALHGAAHR